MPGGTTPAPVFDVLSEIDLDWGRVSVLPNDERWVPETSDRSNARLVREHLLQGRAAAAQFVPLYAKGDRPEDRLDDLTVTVALHLPISVLLLGMGTDMHIASLIPGAEGLDEALSPDAPILMAMRAPSVPEPRVTLTAPVLQAAMTTHIVITGAEKRAAIERAQRLDLIEAPVRAVLDTATVHWAE